MGGCTIGNFQNRICESRQYMNNAVDVHNPLEYNYANGTSKPNQTIETTHEQIIREHGMTQTHANIRKHIEINYDF